MVISRSGDNTLNILTRTQKYTYRGSVQSPLLCSKKYAFFFGLPPMANLCSVYEILKVFEGGE